MDLGYTVARVAEKTPGGVLIFFPSFRTLEQCYNNWDECGIIPKIEQHKLLLREPRDPAIYQDTMQRYYKSIFDENANGAVMMGVCRGKISEGLDFSDNAARCVMIVGIPYPMMTDCKVILKKDFLDKKVRNTALPIEQR